MNPKRFFYALLGLLAAVIAAGGGGYYLAYNALTQQSAALATKMATADEMGSQVDRLSNLQLQYTRDIIPILDLMDVALPREKKQTEILAQLQNIAKQEGLAIASISMPAPVGVPGLTSQTIKTGAVLALPISFQISGSYERLQSFLYKVESLNRFTNVTSLAIAHSDKTKPIVYTISLNAYIKP